MRHGSIFSGIGGFDLAAHWMGWENVFNCEKDNFCKSVLKHYWPGTESYGDVRKFDAIKYRGLIDVLTGGFPCQPFSAAGRRKGTSDDRYLWPEALRVIREVQPTWIILENVAGLFTILEPESISQVEIEANELFSQGNETNANKVIIKLQRRIIGRIISDIGAEGYIFPQLIDGTPIILCIPACSVGAPHRRDRVWIVAHSRSPRFQVEGEFRNGISKEKTQNRQADWPKLLFQGKSLPHLFKHYNGFSERLVDQTFSEWRCQSNKALGNALVPQVAYELFCAIESAELDFVNNENI